MRIPQTRTIFLISALAFVIREGVYAFVVRTSSIAGIFSEALVREVITVLVTYLGYVGLIVFVLGLISLISGRK